MAEEKTDVVVLGAGIVGVSTAYAARQRGMSVVLVDRREPGSETSYGNAGIISSGSISPLNNPSLWKALPKYLTNRHPALRWNPVWALQNAGWVARFLANSAGPRLRPRAAALHGLIGASLKLHREWIVKANAAHRIRETGWLKAWRSDAVAAAKQEQALLAEYGIASELLDRQGISAIEPGIVPVYKVGLLHTQTPRSIRRARWSRPMRGCSRARAAMPGSRTSRRSCLTAIAGAWCWPTARSWRA